MVLSFLKKIELNEMVAKILRLELKKIVNERLFIV